MSDLLKKIRKCLIDLDEDCVVRFVEEALSSGLSATEIVLGPMSAAMEEIGMLYEEGEYFIAELIEAADIFKKVMDLLREKLRGEASQLRSRRRSLKVVIGTVKGDIHDIGKNIVATMLRAANFKVIDLGADVPASKFVEEAKKHNADIVALSACMTTTMPVQKDVIEHFKAAGLRDKVKIIVGGGPVTREWAEEIGADGYGADAIEAVEVAKKLVSKS